MLDFPGVTGGQGLEKLESTYSVHVTLIGIRLIGYVYSC